MPKYINLGNGTVLVGLDKYGQVRDFYYHYPGHENHVSEKLVHKIGIFEDGNLTWIDDAIFNPDTKTKDDTMASDIKIRSESLGIELLFTDCLYNEKNIFIREITVKNLFDRRRDLKIYFNQQFNISQTDTGETAYYDPREKCIIHYKGRRVFLINASSDGKSFDEYSVGLLGIEGKDGTWKDAEDGVLSGNAIEHGAVDSVFSIPLDIPAKSDSKIYYWVCVGKSIEQVKRLQEEVLARHPKEIILSTLNYWKAWVTLRNFNFHKLTGKEISLFNKSLFNIRAHVAKNGAIIASGDSEMLQFGRDYYEYVWPRDGAYTALALSKAGDLNSARKFFKFGRDIISSEGFFMHKYRPDKALGSSWHPWVQNGKEQLPIQEDETAIVISALWNYYKITHDLEFIESLYNDLVKKAAEFMVYYRDDRTSLPKPSYDLWERLYGIHTYTAASVYAALAASAKLAEMLGKKESSQKYKSAADDIKKGIMKYLYDEEEGVFYKSISIKKGQYEIDKTIDFSSVYGVYAFSVLPVDDKKLKKAFEKTLIRLSVNTEVGGIARFEGDSYHHQGGNYPGNPWIITSMWLAQYYIDLAKKEDDLKIVKDLISWVSDNSASSGVLPEQLNAYTGEHLSASPLVWSHAEYVRTVVSYLEKLEELGVCEACNPVG